MDINKINWKSLEEDTQVAIDNEISSNSVVASLEQDLQLIEEKNVKALQEKYGEDFFNDFFD
jgi:hypothetical protein